ncbi:Histone deacetylase-like amidohydrolase [Pseudoalteromonas sp. CIP111854]|uniref:Histone deacetylase-like amidohydrolase n=1 Tax=Pseudoalteromonas holothuriae TaxID=2963714 RepID=A0A9W4QR96_9GAMM|nr:histone deacetylase family protein [Pseudoalteromonas sp. CIP111854]CAH9049733.1 Histone deacetylase-like amidohydrolase [Pseudoalteromonas sp. CIP111854]
MRTAVISHPHCRKHKMGMDHPECPERLDAITDRLLSSGVDATVAHMQAPKADMSHFALVHESSHIKAVCAAIPQHGTQQFADDVLLCPDSFKAIERAVGAGILAVDEVLEGNLDAAFCNVRPPGHHANQKTSSGFCVFNNLAIAVEYAKTKGVERIAILDIDVHHGNGTQDIFRQRSDILFCSLFQYPFYPNTEIENNEHIINSPLPVASKGEDLKALFNQQWLPKLREFNAELIFISAGFDAHIEDDMAGLQFVEADYQWLTEQVIKVLKDTQAKGIISFLEGGYALSALGRSVSTHIKILVEG